MYNYSDLSSCIYLHPNCMVCPDNESYHGRHVVYFHSKDMAIEIQLLV